MEAIRIKSLNRLAHDHLKSLAYAVELLHYSEIKEEISNLVDSHGMLRQSWRKRHLINLSPPKNGPF